MQRPRRVQRLAGVADGRNAHRRAVAPPVVRLVVTLATPAQEGLAITDRRLAVETLICHDLENCIDRGTLIFVGHGGSFRVSRALRKEDLDTLQLLLSAGADSDAKFTYGCQTLLEWLAQYPDDPRYAPIIEALRCHSAKS